MLAGWVQEAAGGPVAPHRGVADRATRLAESLAVLLGRRQRRVRQQRTGDLVMPPRSDALAFAGAPAVERAWPTPSRLRACPDCGLFQVVPSLRAGATARCLRCGAVLRRTHHD